MWNPIRARREKKIQELHELEDRVLRQDVLDVLPIYCDSCGKRIDGGIGIVDSLIKPLMRIGGFQRLRKPRYFCNDNCTSKYYHDHYPITSPTEETLTEILTSDRLIDARLESEITGDPKMVSMAEDGLKELLEMGIELGISEAFKSIGLKMGPPIKRIGENVEQKHAGLGDGKLNLITFNDTEQLRVMLIAIGFSIDDKDIVYHQGKPVICSSCERELTLDEIGYVMPPAHFYCSSDVCICDYFERYGWPDENKPPTEEPFVLDYETSEKDVQAHGGPINHRDTLMEE